eukprot:3805045-Prymnesium_polylepis.1
MAEDLRVSTITSMRRPSLHETGVRCVARMYRDGSTLLSHHREQRAHVVTGARGGLRANLSIPRSMTPPPPF